MKTNILTLIIIATASLNSWSQSVEMEINTTESSINWLAKKVTGQHEGNINLISGNLEMTENKIYLEAVLKQTPNDMINAVRIIDHTESFSVSLIGNSISSSLC